MTISVNNKKFLRGHVRTVLRKCLSNLKSIALTVLELLAFSAQKFRGSRDRGHAPFSKNFFKWLCLDSPENMLVKSEVRHF